MGPLPGPSRGTGSEADDDDFVDATGELPSWAAERRRTVLLAAGAAAVVSVVVSMIVALVVVGLADGGDGGGADTVQRPSSTIAGQLSRGADAATLVAIVRPAVVAVRPTGGGSVGSGVIISPQGEVVTNAHVLRRGSGRDDLVSRVTLQLADGSEVPATLVGASVDDDLALLRMEGGLRGQIASFGEAAALQVGDDVLAIGNAADLAGPATVTRGIVSALGREVQADGGLRLRGLVQTDAAVNEGSSGGPLVNAAGNVVGITTAILGDAENVGFAIPAERVLALLDQLRQGGGAAAEPGFLGVTTLDVGELTDEQRRDAGITVADGAFVTDALGGEPAAVAGVQADDVIVAIGGEPVTGADDVARLVRSRRPGEVVQIDVLRRGLQLRLAATLGSRGS